MIGDGSVDFSQYKFKVFCHKVCLQVRYHQFETVEMLRGFVRGFSYSRLNRNTLAFLEAVDGKVTPASLSSISAATQLGKPITALLAGPQGKEAAEEACRISGVSKVLVAEDELLRHYLAEPLLRLLQTVFSLSDHAFTHMVAPGLAVGKLVLPRAAAMLDLQPVSDIIKVIDPATFVRPIYAGNALATVKSSEPKVLILVRASAFPAAQASPEATSVEQSSFPFTNEGPSSEFVSQSIVTSERPELSAASVVVSGGRGLKNKETFDALMEPLASKLHAAIGATRAAVDAGYCDNSLQVGQTGKIVAPDLYVAVGVSGAIQHLAGMKDSKTIVAINKDADAPIFSVADIGLVADLNEAVPELCEKL